MPLMTQVVSRNTANKVVVLSSDPKGSEYVEWQAADDPSGGDVQIVPESIANSVPFAKLVQRGIVVVENMEDNPGLQEAIERQNAAFQRRTTGAAQDAKAAIDQEANNDLIQVPCVGPDSRGGLCGDGVPVREITKDEKPPLCPKHANLAPQYVPSEEQEGTKTVKKWFRATVGARETQQ